jgi:creatinine amidohydrolase
MLPLMFFLALAVPPVAGAQQPAGAPPSRQSAGSAPSPAPSPSVFLEELTWTELRDAVRAGHTTAIVPVGGTEQSGPQIVLGKHNVRVRALCGRIAVRLGNAIVAPVLAYVPEGSVSPPSSHMRFPGTITVPESVFEATLESAAESLRAAGFRDIVILGDHGGYQKELARVAERLNHRWGRGGARAHAPLEYFRASTDDFARLLRERGFRDDEIGTHGALSDTSLQLAIDPAGVRQQLLQGAAPLDERVGVYGGNPRRSQSQLGELGAAQIVERTVEAIRAATARSSPSPALRAGEGRGEGGK